jgi:hypothetical protein
VERKAEEEHIQPINSGLEKHSTQQRFQPSSTSVEEKNGTLADDRDPQPLVCLSISRLKIGTGVLKTRVRGEIEMAIRQISWMPSSSHSWL